MKNKNFSRSFAENRREAIIALSSFFAIALVFFYPSKTPLESLWISLFLFFLFPALTVKHIFQKKLADFGMGTGNALWGIPLLLASLAAFSAFFFFALKSGYFPADMRLPAGISKSLWAFLAFQIFLSLPLHFFWEFFFRGYLQFGLAPKIGKGAILLSAACQLALSGKMSLEITGFYFLSFLTAGVIAQKSRSIYYSFLFLWLLSAIADIMVIRNSLAG